MAKKKDEVIVDNTSDTLSTTNISDEMQPATITVKQELESLYAEMVRLQVSSIGQVEVKISQQK